LLKLINSNLMTISTFHLPKHTNYLMKSLKQSIRRSEIYKPILWLDYDIYPIVGMRNDCCSWMTFYSLLSFLLDRLFLFLIMLLLTAFKSSFIFQYSKCTDCLLNSKLNIKPAFKSDSTEKPNKIFCHRHTKIMQFTKNWFTFRVLSHITDILKLLLNWLSMLLYFKY
jgi:hypothetical protein